MKAIKEMVESAGEKSIKILLINPLNSAKNSYYGVHLAFGYLCSYYEKYGNNYKDVKFDIFDECLNINRLEDFNCSDYDLIGLSLTTPQLKRTREIAKYLRIKAPKSTIIAGGVHSTVRPKDVLGIVDTVCIGAGEETFLDLVDNYLFEKRDLKEIKGICYKTKSGEIVFTEKRGFIKDLDRIPRINYKFFTRAMKKKYFRRSYDMGHFWRAGQVITTRGCPYNCTFCSANSIWHRKVWMHSAEYVIDEIKYLVREHKINYLGFFDDIFTLDEKRTRKICKYLKTTNLRWSCNARVETVCRPSFRGLLEEMKEAGCFIMHFGFESGSERIMKFMKGQTSSLESYQKAIDLVYKAGIKIHGFFMLGTQGETIEDIMATKKFAEKNLHKIYSADFYITTPFPGTALWDICKKRNLVSDKDVEEFSDLGVQYITEKTYCDTVPEEVIHETRYYLKNRFYSKKPWGEKALWFLMKVIDSPAPTLRFVFNFYLRKIKYFRISK